MHCITPAFDSLKSKEIFFFPLCCEFVQVHGFKKASPDHPQHHHTTHPLLGRAGDLAELAFSPSFCGGSAALGVEWETRPLHSTTAKPLFV